MTTIARRLTISILVAVVAVLGLATAPASAQDRNVLIINETRHTIVAFYASNIGRDTWEENILGPDVLPVGQAININFYDGTEACLYDFKAVFDDGDELVRNRIDVCAIGTYRYTQE